MDLRVEKDLLCDHMIPELADLVIDYAHWNKQALDDIDVLKNELIPIFSKDDVKVGDVVLDCYSLDAYIITKKLRVNVKGHRILSRRQTIEQDL